MFPNHRNIKEQFTDEVMKTKQNDDAMTLLCPKMDAKKRIKPIKTKALFLH